MIWPHRLSMRPRSCGSNDWSAMSSRMARPWRREIAPLRTKVATKPSMPINAAARYDASSGCSRISISSIGESEPPMVETGRRAVRVGRANSQVSVALGGVASCANRTWTAGFLPGKSGERRFPPVNDCSPERSHAAPARFGRTRRRRISPPAPAARSVRPSSISPGAANGRPPLSPPSSPKCWKDRGVSPHSSMNTQRGVRYGSRGPRRLVIGPGLRRKAG